MDLEAIQARMARGTEPWKTLEELDDDHEVRRWLEDEFPDRAILPTTSRRDLLRMMGASLALAGIAGCRGAFLPQTHLVPYVAGPPEQTYGEPISYRSALVRHGYGIGIEVVTRDGRPIKVEGNPHHPASLGSADAIAQASLLQFYDPDRSRVPIYAGEEATWDSFVRMAQDKLGSGLRILTETVTSPTLARQISDLQSRVPGVHWHSYEPVNRDAAYAASILAFNQPLAPVYAMENAEVVLGVDFDLNRTELGRFGDAMQMVGKGRRVYSVSCTPTLMHNIADHTRPLSPPNIARFLQALASAVGVTGVSAEVDPWTQVVANDLMSLRGRCIVAVGETQPPELQALGYAINSALGNLGSTLYFVRPVEASSLGQANSLIELVTAMRAGQVGALLVLGANPVYNVPASVGFSEALARVPFSVHHGHYRDETGVACDWHIPSTHEFESWSDVRAFDGSYTIIQPQLQPIYSGRSSHDLISMLAGKKLFGLEIIRETWRHLPEDRWTDALRFGRLGTSTKIVPKIRSDFAVQSLPTTGMVALFRPDPHIDDGRNANNGWLQEAPKPHTGLVWENAMLMSPSCAASLGLNNGDHVEVAVGGRTCFGPTWITPGHAEQCVTLPLGYGRSAAGPVGNGIGFDAYAIRRLDSPDQAPADLRKGEGRTDLVSTQSHHRMDGADLIKTVGPSAAVVREQTGYGFHDLSAKWDQTPDVPQWGMSIDLDRCIGCNACVVACQAENNISTVGKEEVRLGREMHWIRVDRYYTGKDIGNPETLLQPVTCMQCETAPCEPVCPVAATVHSREGLNQMVYNRCVGTRYCSNNCPYKVRRFNYLNYQLLQPNYEKGQSIQLLRLLNNPDVTVRSRGVMEKCSYCIQRITSARIKAKEEGRRIADGEVVTACAQACPTKTIVFGDLTDPDSVVRRLRQDPREYPLLPEEMTVPRTTYLARIANPNKELPDA